MDPYTIACLSADPSWRSDNDPFEKEAMIKMLGTGAWNGLKAFGRGWKGMSSLRNAERIENLAKGLPWYKRLPWSPKATPISALSNPVYQNAHRAANTTREINRIHSSAQPLYRVGSLARGYGGTAAATSGSILTPLAFAQAGTEPIRNARQYAHGYTDASTRAMEEISNTPWWKIMGMGLGKAFDKDILWNKVVDPIAGRGYWESLRDGFDSKGIRGAFEETARTFGAREMFRKRDQIRSLGGDPNRINNPDYLQSVVDELAAYRQSLLEAQTAQQTQS